MSRYILFSLLAISISLSGCWGSDDPEPEEVAEIPTGIGNVTDGSQEELIYASKRLYESGIYSISKENLEALKNNYPEGPYVEFAEIKVADSEFAIRNYSESAILYEEFVKDHPSSQTVPYAILRAGRSHQLSSRGVGRDSEPMAKAAEYYGTILSDYPDSPYVEAATRYREKALSDLAESEKLIMEYYKGLGKEAAYEARKAEFEDKWAALIKTEEELEAAALVKNTVPEGIVAETESPEKVLLASTYKDSARASMRPKKGSNNSAASAPANRPRIQQVKCLTQGKKRANIYFTKALDRKFNNELGKLEPKNGKITLNLPAMATRPIAVDCLAEKDLKINTLGKLELRSETSVSTMVLKHPDRLLILFD